MKKLMSIILSAVIFMGFSGCINNNSSTADDGKIKIIATLFPQYDFAKQIVGDKANVELLLPPGVDSHSFDPTPSDIVDINKSDMFVYTGEYMEVWAENLISGMESKNVKIVDVSAGISLTKEADEHHHDDAEEHQEDAEEHEEHHHEYDPHIWTNPQFAKIMVDNILAGICEVDSENADFYKQNAEKYKAELDRIDSEFESIVSSSKHKEIFFGGKFAMYYFAERYGLEWVAAFDSCSTETEPSAKVVAQMISEMNEKDIKVIFYEELIDPKAAKTIAEETGAKPLLLHSCHNVSKDDFKKGVTYISLMEQNIINLREGLN